MFGRIIMGIALSFVASSLRMVVLASGAPENCAKPLDADAGKLGQRVDKALEDSRAAALASSASGALAELPAEQQARWRAAEPVTFPLPAAQRWFVADYRDQSILKKLSESRALNEQGLPLGSMKDKEYQDKVLIEGVVESGGVNQQVLLQVRGRSYRVQLATLAGTPEQAGVPYRSMEKTTHVRSAMPWESIAENHRTWLQSPEALGLAVLTPKNTQLTRVDDARFRHLGASWRDEQTGLTWSAPSKGGLNHAAAEDFCKKLGARLATKEELEDLAGKQGHKILAWTGRWLWSSSVDPFNAEYAYVLVGGNGYIVSVNRNYYNYSNAAVCVAP